ncbi:alpha/beta fold hydrolase [Xanthomonas oryzae pv. oryzicola]|uniref:alpha/beta fold hydrolase n=1 Tax=Xanthomonas oryzae TaxID=347 RepID=UPI0004256C6F|nr:alpha/beta fold hydrolase [Xanthomonas oryzae]AKO05680.1 hydrolase [Xanthomonas oryzae pv. oryzicola]AKO09575.1 hydrolase [Xanthomonas oryzae pv. oryzicola]OWB31965.1 alpha/beta hydrolase [Xanthomonas oryzae pv. oryzicola]
MLSSAHSSSRPVLLLLCGLLCDAAIWQPQRAALRDLADVQVVDFAGFDSITQMAAHVLAIAPPQFALAGHSMGGRVALEIVRQAPARLLRLALLDTGIAPRRDGEREERLRLVRLAHAQGMHALAQRWLPPMLHPDHTADAELMDGLVAMVQRQSAQSFAGQTNALLKRLDATPLLAQIACPTLLGVGRQDAWSPLARHQDMARQIPKARLAIFEDCGHMAPVEAPAAVSGALRDWLQVA